mmetsp:Transcript_14125/g.29577  ORF Transcript_14125/g.29577 Transcript_14125/m.29577 type:complete len:448 (-) Transcript_14125:73-1416(-)
MLSNKDLERLLVSDDIDAGYDDIPKDDVPSVAVAKSEACEEASPAPVAESAGGSASSTEGASSLEREEPTVLCDGLVELTFLVRCPGHGPRLVDGQEIAYRTEAGEPLREATIGGPELPWGLEVAARRGLQVGEVCEVLGRGEYALADMDQEAAPPEGRRWRFEVATVSGSGKSKFSLKADERIEWANELRERGNAMLKRGRILRAGDYYDRGSSLLDIIEAEDTMPGKKDQKAVATNTRIRECQKPLLLNWGLVLTRQGKWETAERKFTEVLLDIDKHCVKALFRRGQCFAELSRCEEARHDLLHARDLDDAIAADVEKELAKVARKQKAIDSKSKGFMKKALAKGLSDSRSEKAATAPSAPAQLAQDDDNEGIDCHVKESSTTRLNPSTGGAMAASDSDPNSSPLIERLKAQERAAMNDGVDEITWCRQREALYNSILRPTPVED